MTSPWANIPSRLYTENVGTKSYGRGRGGQKQARLENLDEMIDLSLNFSWIDDSVIEFTFIFRERFCSLLFSF